MKITHDQALNMLNSGFILVKDSKAKILHSVNQTTGETEISYQVRYLLQSIENPYDQRGITATLAGKLAKGNKESILECFQWSSHK